MYLVHFQERVNLYRQIIFYMFIFSNAFQAEKILKQNPDITNMSTEALTIQNERWKHLKMKEICSKTKYCKANSLSLTSNKQPTIYKDLIGVQFLGLRVLDLSKNQIASIEQVSFISMPALQTIVLADNKLAKIREIRKCNWPILHELNIDSNNILDAETIPLASPCYNFQHLKLEYQMHSPIQSQDLRWLMKFNAVTFSTLFCKNQGRIKKICVFDKLKEKIKGIRISPINYFAAFYDSSDDDFGLF